MIYSLFKTTTMILCRKLDRAWKGTVCSITFGKVSSAEKTQVTEGWHYLKVSLFISLGSPGMTQSAGPAGAVVWSPCPGLPLHVGSPCVWPPPVPGLPVWLGLPHSLVALDWLDF